MLSGTRDLAIFVHTQNMKPWTVETAVRFETKDEVTISGLNPDILGFQNVNVIQEKCYVASAIARKFI